jgi:hypothetical protein
MSIMEEKNEEIVFSLDNLKLFQPTLNDMRIDYPELMEIGSFKDLPPNDLKFVWHVSNRSSDLVRNKTLSKEERWKAAANLVYGKISINTRKDVQEILSGDPPERIKEAIKDMVKFNPTLRLRAKFMAEYALDQVQQMLYVPADEMQGMDGDMRAKYASFIFSSNKEIPKLIEQLERGYGISLKNKRGDEATYKSMASIRELTTELE